MSLPQDCKRQFSGVDRQANPILMTSHFVERVSTLASMTVAYLGLTAKNGCIELAGSLLPLRDIHEVSQRTLICILKG